MLLQTTTASPGSVELKISLGIVLEWRLAQVANDREAPVGVSIGLSVVRLHSFSP